MGAVFDVLLHWMVGLAALFGVAILIVIACAGWRYVIGVVFVVGLTAALILSPYYIGKVIWP